MISDKPRKRRPVELLQHVALLFVISTIPRQRGDKRSPGLYSTPQHDSPADDDEHPVRLGTTLINEESCRPGRPRSVCGNGIRNVAG